MQEQKKCLWTPEMENKLIELNSRGNMFDREIGLELGGLTAKQVYYKKRTLFSANGKVAVKKKRFTSEEDGILIKYCTTHCRKNGSISWNEINECLPGRSIRQCRDRWLNYLSLDVNISKPWTEEEDEIILKAVKELGPRYKVYSMLGKQLNRSVISIRNHYYKSLRQIISPNKLKTMEQQLNVNMLLIQEAKIINEALCNMLNEQGQNSQNQGNNGITLP